ncbi:hypothetical protein ACFV4N_42145 [Actinosynnema sp. NPDC059797]
MTTRSQDPPPGPRPGPPLGPRPADPYGVIADSGAREPVVASAASGVAVLAGLWAAVAPFTQDGPRWWHDVALGAVIALLSLVRSLAPARAAWLSLVVAVSGLWLLCSPVLLDHRPHPVTAAVVGAVVVVAGVVGAVVTHRYRRPGRVGGGGAS